MISYDSPKSMILYKAIQSNENFKDFKISIGRPFLGKGTKDNSISLYDLPEAFENKVLASKKDKTRIDRIEIALRGGSYIETYTKMNQLIKELVDREDGYYRDIQKELGIAIRNIEREGGIQIYLEDPNLYISKQIIRVISINY